MAVKCCVTEDMTSLTKSVVLFLSYVKRKNSVTIYPDIGSDRLYFHGDDQIVCIFTGISVRYPIRLFVFFA